MADPDLASDRVRVPGPRYEPALPHPASRRRHKWLTVPSSVLLVLCIFLPTLRVCGEPTTPLGFPMFWTPYVVGAIVFAATFALRPAALSGFALALRVVLGITAVGFGVPIVGAMLSGWPDPLVLVVYPALAIVISAVVVPARSHEAMIARCGLVTGLGSTIWFTVLAADRDAMFGAYVSLVAAVGLGIGCASWWLEAPRQRFST